MGYSAYDRFGLPYDIHRVLTPDKQLNITAYQEYSPVYLPVTFALTYFVAFMITTSVIVQTILYEGPAILAAVRGTKVEDDDIHAKLMRHYPEVPSYYYLGVFLVGISMLIGAIQVGEPPSPFRPHSDTVLVARRRHANLVPFLGYNNAISLHNTVCIRIREEWNSGTHQSCEPNHPRCHFAGTTDCKYGKCSGIWKELDNTDVDGRCSKRVHSKAWLGLCRSLKT